MADSSTAGATASAADQDDLADPTEHEDAHGDADRGGDQVNTNAVKDPADWVTGGEPMTGPQSSYLHTLAPEAGAEIPESLTKAEASEQIEKLQQETGRG